MRLVSDLANSLATSNATITATDLTKNMITIQAQSLSIIHEFGHKISVLEAEVEKLKKNIEKSAITVKTISSDKSKSMELLDTAKSSLNDHKKICLSEYSPESP